jgi:hypothetical protein
MDINDQMLKKIGVVGLLSKLGYQFWNGFWAGSALGTAEL